MTEPTQPTDVAFQEPAAPAATPEAPKDAEESTLHHFLDRLETLAKEIRSHLGRKDNA